MAAAPAEDVQALSIPEPDSQLVAALYHLSAKAPKLVRSTEYAAPADPSTVVRSWKMSEHRYYDVPSPFPTLARGLYTQDLPGGKHRIVARGYDKFFNIGEVPWTAWAALEAHTAPPYTLTLKSNGCIILVAALTPSKLLVTSKHALGPGKGPSESHAIVGERWLRKHLADVGKTEAELAATLWDKNWTAVAELCDDSFEEHVLPYSRDKTGLHLHGLNASAKDFHTMHQDTVDAFAREWGFIPTRSVVLQSIPEVQSLTADVGRSGSWNGEAIEGFVVRTHVAPLHSADSRTSPGPPYAPGASLFFKVKFDDPYMMYRDWREVTKTLLTKGADRAHVPKSKLRRAETQVYVDWVIREIKRNPAPFAEYTKGRGIIATREMFLEWLNSPEGRASIEGTSQVPEEKRLDRLDKNKFGKTVVVPVAIPGVGKTTIAVALAHLFGFGHTQSDDVQAKKAGSVFVNKVVGLLKTHDVVIADKNNHLRMHRQALRDATRDFSPPVRLMALHWSFDQPPATLHRVCSDRVLVRGDNHQVLRADPRDKAHEDVIWQFLHTAEELADTEVDVEVEMDFEETPEEALARAVDACVRILGVPRPEPEQVGAALAAARAYVPKTKKPDAKKKTAAPRYYGILAEVDLPRVLGARVAEADVPEQARAFWGRLVVQKRVVSRPHVTIVHSKEVPAEDALWGRCRGLQTQDPPPMFSFRLGHLVWDDRIMAATVTDLAVSADDEDPDHRGLDWAAKLSSDVRARLHITVGTRDGSVSPVEAKDLVLRWKEKGAIGTVGAIELQDVWVKGRVKGLMS